jgi:hypothetical protein
MVPPVDYYQEFEINKSKIIEVLKNGTRQPKTDNLLIFKRDVIDDSKFPRGITIFADTPEI